jgi:alpha-beta hydrolase superfamily lysophospholipase
MTANSNDQYSNFSLTSKDGIKLQGFTFKPEKPVFSLIVVHGVGEHSKRYLSFAKKISAANGACYLYDQRGHGGSDGKRGHVAKFVNYSNDLLDIFEMVFSKSQGCPVFVYGHSMGSVVATLFALSYQAKIKGLILSGFPAIPSISIVGWPLKLIKSIRKIAPLQNIPTLLNPKHLCHDPNVWKAYEEDPMINKTVTLNWAAEFYSALKEIKNNIHNLFVPLLMLHGSDDKIAKLKGAQQTFQTIHSTDKTLQIYKGQRHELLNEVSPIPDQVTDCMLDWMQKRL